MKTKKTNASDERVMKQLVLLMADELGAQATTVSALAAFLKMNLRVHHKELQGFVERYSREKGNWFAKRVRARMLKGLEESKSKRRGLQKATPSAA